MNLNQTSRFVFTLMAGLACQAMAEDQTPVSVSKPLLDANQSRFQFTGTITSERVASISPRVAGLVAKANAEMGHSAKAGDMLVALDDTLARMELREKELNLEAAQAELINSKRRLDEAVNLGDANFPRSERENRETTYRMAQIAVSRLETLVETQREIVERHRIIAPFDGMVAEKMAEVGEWVQTGNPVLQFVDTDNLRLDVQVPQEQLALVMGSETVMVKIAGAGEKAFEAHIEARSPQVDPQTRTFQVRIELNKPSPNVKPGMSAVAIFKPSSEAASIFITRDALLRTTEGQVMVWVAESSGVGFKASRRIVQTGPTSGDYIQIVSGLQPDAQIIFQGNESLQEGQAIRIVESVIPVERQR
jgi:membrane fusion protein (multidrug efflux system)